MIDQLASCKVEEDVSNFNRIVKAETKKVYRKKNQNLWDVISELIRWWWSLIMRDMSIILLQSFSLVMINMSMNNVIYYCFYYHRLKFHNVLYLFSWFIIVKLECYMKMLCSKMMPLAFHCLSNKQAWQEAKTWVLNCTKKPINLCRNLTSLH